MSLFKNDNSEIKCFKFTESNKIIKTSVQNLLNQEKNCYGFVENKMFGIDHVYSLIDFSKVKEFNINNLLVNYEIIEKFIKVNGFSLPLFIATVPTDCPVINGINLKSNTLILDNFNSFEWILLYQLKNIIDGMNNIMESRDNTQYYLNFGNTIEDEECPFDLSLLNFSPNKRKVIDDKYNYILEFSNGQYDCCNFIYTNEFEGIFIKIPEFNCWQYLSKKKFMRLNKINNLHITYAITDNPRCFSKVGYHQEYFMDTINEILAYSIYIPMDIYFNKLFGDSNDNIENNTYDALQIDISRGECNINVLLTYDELGIDQIFSSNKENQKRIISNIKYMDRFCLLKLINKIIQLKP